ALAVDALAVGALATGTLAIGVLLVGIVPVGALGPEFGWSLLCEVDARRTAGTIAGVPIAGLAIALGAAFASSAMAVRMTSSRLSSASACRSSDGTSDGISRLVRRGWYCGYSPRLEVPGRGDSNSFACADGRDTRDVGGPSDCDRGDSSPFDCVDGRGTCGGDGRVGTCE